MHPNFVGLAKANGVRGKSIAPVFQANAAMEEQCMLMYVSDANPTPSKETGRISGGMIKGLVEQFN